MLCHEVVHSGDLFMSQLKLAFVEGELDDLLEASQKVLLNCLLLIALCYNVHDFLIESELGFIEFSQLRAIQLGQNTFLLNFFELLDGSSHMSHFEQQTGLNNLRIVPGRDQIELSTEPNRFLNLKQSIVVKLILFEDIGNHEQAFHVLQLVEALALAIDQQILTAVVASCQGSLSEIDFIFQSAYLYTFEGSSGLFQFCQLEKGVLQDDVEAHLGIHTGFVDLGQQLVFAFELLVNGQLKEFLSIVIGVDQQILQRRNLRQDGQLMDQTGDHQIAVEMENIPTVVFVMRMQFLLGKVQSILPADLSILQQGQRSVSAIIFFLEQTAAETGIESERKIVLVQRMGNGVFGQQDLLAELAQLLSHMVQVDNTIINGLFIGVVLRDSQAFRNRLQALIEMLELEARVRPTEDTMVDLIASQILSHPILEQITQILIKVSPQIVRALSRSPFLGKHDALQVAGLESVIVLGYTLHNFLQLFRVGLERIVLEIELNFFDGLGQHELVLLQRHGNAIFIADETFVDLHYLFEIKFLKINVEPPDKEVHKIALFQLATPHAPQILQYIGDLAIEFIKTVNGLDTLPITLKKRLIIRNREHLSLKLLIRVSRLGRIGDGQNFIQQVIDKFALDVDLLVLGHFLQLVEAEEKGEGLRIEEVRVYC